MVVVEKATGFDCSSSTLANYLANIGSTLGSPLANGVNKAPGNIFVEASIKNAFNGYYKNFQILLQDLPITRCNSILRTSKLIIRAIFFHAKIKLYLKYVENIVLMKKFL